jgi:hypothetical protein
MFIEMEESFVQESRTICEVAKYCSAIFAVFKIYEYSLKHEYQLVAGGVIAVDSLPQSATKTQHCTATATPAHS